MTLTRNSHIAFPKLLTLCLLSMCFILSACTSKDAINELQAHKSSFDKILTNQYRERYGRGGIYWISEKEIVLDAYIGNDEGLVDRGLYQVNVESGDAIKIVDIPEDDLQEFEFCFDGETLYLLTSSKSFQVSEAVLNYEIRVRELEKKTKTNHYSALQCRFIEKHVSESSYTALMKADGFIEYFSGSESLRKIFLVNPEKHRVKPLLDQTLERGVYPKDFFSVSYFLPENNAYFGYSIWDNDCTKLWWLFRDAWQIHSERLCVDGWAFGSKMLFSLKGAIYAESHTNQDGEPKSYLLLNDHEIPIEREPVRGSSVSPDGCMVAYGVNIAEGTRKGPIQRLQIFDYCGFKSKEAKSFG